MRWFGILILTLLFAGCQKTSKQNVKPEPPAKVEKQPIESEINRITLTPDAYRRLGIELQTATRKQVQDWRTLGGEILIPNGKSIVIAAPFSGIVSATLNTEIPQPGQRLEFGAAVMTLTPLLSPEREVPTPAEQVQMANARSTIVAAITVAKGDIARLTEEVDAGTVTLQRAQQLLADRAGSQRAVDDAQAIVNVAKSNLEAAKDREQQLSSLLENVDRPVQDRAAAPLELISPQPGILRSLNVTAGQAVTAGTSLFEISDINTMWIRVPVYVDMLKEVNTNESARIVSLGTPSSTELSHSPSSPQIEAKPVVAPPTADPISSTVDLYYEFQNESDQYRSGQRVGVQLPLFAQQETLVIPRSSIIYDIYGGTWVYLKVDELSFERRRVLIRFVDGELVGIGVGLNDGDSIVSEGAAELFGTEFGAGK